MKAMTLLKRFNSLLSRLFQNDGFSIMFVFVGVYAYDPRPELGQIQVYLKLGQAAFSVYTTRWLINRYRVKKPLSPENPAEPEK
jgi:hypothetical protein